MIKTDPLLEVHILGSGFGESVVVRFPSKKWGVIDCVKTRTKDGTYEFLKKTGVEELHFLCLTHLSLDRYQGMAEILRDFKVRNFIQPGVLGPDALRKLLLEPQLKRLGEYRHYKVLAQLLRTLEQSRKDTSLPKIRLGIAQTLMHSEETAARISGLWCLSPSAEQINKYQSQLARRLESQLDVATAPADLPIRSFRPRRSLSMALSLQFGATRLIVGGAADSASWNDIIDDVGPENLSATAVIASHHGSYLGYTDRLWEYFSSRGRPIAIITPHHLHNLPDDQTIDHIRKFARTLILTNPDPSEFTPIRSALANRISQFPGALSVRSIPKSANIGICSLNFDSDGNCVSLALEGGAEALPSPNETTRGDAEIRII